MAGARGSMKSNGRAQTGGQAPGGGRTLTIGEAAARLSAEFPGTTVAVLRRLETAGRFTAGRSSAGYRRYSEADLDLIRIVLSEQLGILTPRAADSDVTADPADLSGAESPLAHPAVYAAGAAQAYATAIAAQRPAAARTTARAGRASSTRLSGIPAARTAGSGHPQPSATATTVTPTTPVPAAAASPTTARRGDRRWPDAEFFTPDLGEVALDRDQLAAAARTDRAWVDGLVEYGVLPGTESSGGADLLVARASAELAQFGVEPRHLRAVAASAARVAELINAATSTGAVRDPARRERAILAAPGRGAEAAAAAVRLHAALVRAALLRG